MMLEDIKRGTVDFEVVQRLLAMDTRTASGNGEMEEILERKSKGVVWLDYFTEHKNIEKLTRNVDVSLIREVRVMDKNSIEVIFDFDDCYRECMDNLGRLGYGVDCDGTGKDIQHKESEALAEGNIVLADTEQTADGVAGMERRAV